MTNSDDAEIAELLKENDNPFADETAPYYPDGEGIVWWTSIKKENTPLPTPQQLADYERFKTISKKLQAMGFYTRSSDDFKRQTEIKSLVQAIRAKLGMRQKYVSNHYETCPPQHANAEICELIKKREQLIAEAQLLANEGDAIFNRQKPNHNSAYFGNHIKDAGALD